MTTDSFAPTTNHDLQSKTPLPSGWKAAGLLVFVAVAVFTLALLSFVLRPAPSLQAERIGEQGDVEVAFSSDRAFVVLPNDCLTARWQVTNPQAVRLNGASVPATGEQSVCLNAGTPPVLSVDVDDSTRDYPLNVVVLAQNRLILLATALSVFLMGCAILLTPPVAWRAQKLYATMQARIQQTDSQVAPAAVLTRMQQLLRWALLGMSILYLLLFAGIAVSRIGHPYELEWMEGASVDTVIRILHGQPLYTAPSIEYVSPIYGPVYFYVSALFSLVFGTGYFPLRLVSLLSAVGCFIIIYRFVKRETGDSFAGWLALGLFAATFNAAGSWFDLARVDSLFLFLLLLGIYLVKFHPSPRGYMLAGIVFSLSVLTKQAALIPLALIGLYCLLTQLRATIYLLVTLTLILGGTTLLADYGSNGWYSYFIFGLAEQKSIVGPMIIEFWRTDLFLLALPALLLIVVIYRQIAIPDIVRARFYTLLAAGMIFGAWMGRLHAGAWVNALFPAYAALALFFGMGVALFTRLTADLPLEKRSPILVGLYLACVVQFVALLYEPSTHIPTEQDRQAGEQFVETIRNVDGDVLLFGHGYYAAMAGKSEYQLGWLMNVLGEHESPMRTAFIASMNDAIAQQRFAAIIGDNATFLHENFDAALNRYYEVMYLPYNETEFMPVTGMETRPTFLFTPRSSPEQNE